MRLRPTARELRKAAKIAALLTRDGSASPSPKLDFAGAARLEEALFGHVVWPWDPEYEEARQGQNPLYQAYPLAIVYCEATEDVRQTLRFVADAGLKAVCRSGGHSFAGFSVLSDRVIIDVSQMRCVHVDSAARRATVGAGACFDRINAELEFHGLHVPGAGCGSVAVAGFMQGGGYGFTSRQFGMNCDSVVEVTLMLPSGEFVRANATDHPEVYWAVRGGTGNNFGVLLEVTYALRPLKEVWAFRAQWEIAHAARVLQALLDGYTKTGAPDELGYLAGLVRDPKGAPALVMMGLFDGGEEEGKKLLAPLLQIGGAALQVNEMGSYNRMNTRVQVAPYDIPNVRPDQTMFVARSRYIDRSVGRETWQSVVDRFLASGGQGTFVVVEPYGGAIAKQPPGTNAFDHREPYMNVWASAYFGAPGEQAAAQSWTTGLIDGLLSPFGDRAYQNYPNRDMPDFTKRFWSESTYDRLRRLREQCDPAGVFTFEQSV